MVAVGETISGWKLGRGRGSRLYSGDSRNRRAVCAGTVPMVNNLYQGMPLDPATGLYYERARWYSPSLGTWISQDPAGYVNGADTYQFVESDPVGEVDALGVHTGYSPNWGNGVGPLIFNYELLKISVCPQELSKAMAIARQELHDFTEFNQGNIANVSLFINHGGIYATFGLNPLIYAVPNFLNGNDNVVRLIWNKNNLEAVTQDNHFLVGIRRWYVMQQSSDTFLIFTEAYERSRGFINSFGDKWVIDLRKMTFKIWDKELFNVAHSVRQNFKDAKWGKNPLRKWHLIPGQTNLTGNPWINSLPPSEGPGAAPPPPPLNPPVPIVWPGP